MNQFTTEIVEALVKNQDITEVFRTHLETAVNTLLATELTAFLITKNMIESASTLAIHAIVRIHARYIQNTVI